MFDTMMDWGATLEDILTECGVDREELEEESEA
jgi:hypothetical protein